MSYGDFAAALPERNPSRYTTLFGNCLSPKLARDERGQLQHYS